MKLGMNMLLWSGDVSGPEYQPVFEMLRDAGFDGIEVPIFDTSPESFAGYEELGRRLADLGLTALGVGARSGDDSPISPDPEVRERGLRATNAAVGDHPPSKIPDFGGSRTAGWAGVPMVARPSHRYTA